MAPSHPTPLDERDDVLEQPGGEPALQRMESKPGIWLEGHLPACVFFLEPSSKKAFFPLQPRPQPPAADHLQPKHPVPAQGLSSWSSLEPWQGFASPQPTSVPPGERRAAFSCASESRPQAATCSCPVCAHASSFQEVRDVRLPPRFLPVFADCW